MFNRKPHSVHRLPAGFSLVEIMVGMVIGMLGIIVIMQLYSVSEGQKRTTTGAGDAQNNGAIALYGMQRDIRQAGYGFSAYNLFGCSVTMLSGKVVPLAPVTINPATSIIPAGDANTDSLLLMYGNTNGEPQGSVVTASGATYALSSSGSFAVNDYVIGAPATCTSNLVFDRVAAADATTVTVNVGAAGATALYNLGQAPKVLGYAVRGGNLTICDYVANDCSNVGNWVSVADNIVSLKAQYGHDTTVPQTAASYVVNTYDQTTPVDACGRVRAPAVRIALTARSAQYEKTGKAPDGTPLDVTATAPAWEGGTIDLTGNTDWQHYRYKVFQTIVPLRNITWMGVQTGC